MPSLSTTIEVPVDLPVVYRYLRDRYDGEAYRFASLSVKGYVPSVMRVVEIDNRSLRFTVPGRDPLLRMPIGSWTWGYDIESAAAGRTRITIEYTWSVLLSVLSAWTVRHQAANEIAETALALQALAFGRDEPPRGLA